MTPFTVVEICAGAGGQALGLHRAGFDHVLAVEIDERASETLRLNSDWNVAVGDVADKSVWNPADYKGVSLFAGGVPCPPFSSAGKQLGSADERDLFAWAVEQVAVIQPRALLLENVRGLSGPRFGAYRQRILDRLATLGYKAEWRLVQAADFGVAQLRPRFILLALRPDDAEYFRWPEPNENRVTVGDALVDLMSADGWPYAEAWRKLANNIGPTLVGGSKKHGGADLGPTRAKLAWSRLAVDGRGVADQPPGPDWPHPSERPPRLTIPMVARLQGWSDQHSWQFSGRKTSQYRQIGNAFPPPVAESLGRAIIHAFQHKGEKQLSSPGDTQQHDAVYSLLAEEGNFVEAARLLALLGGRADETHLRDRLERVALDFELEQAGEGETASYRLGPFRGFVGQQDHHRHAYLTKNKSRIS